MRFTGIPIYKSTVAPKFHDDGRPRLYMLCRMTTPWHVLVHPDRWDAFWMAINQPDVYAHPDVQELLGVVPR